MSKAQAQHTPGPWFIGTGASQNAVMIRRDAKRGQAICQVFYAEQCPETLAGTGRDNAARIIACVNALAGIPDPAEFVRAAKELSREAEMRHKDECGCRPHTHAQCIFGSLLRTFRAACGGGE